MKKFTSTTLVCFFTIGMALFFTPFAGAITLDVPERFQEYNQWCWAGVSQATMEYYGTFLEQSEIAQYGTNGVNTWNYLYGSDASRNGINMIMNNWGFACTYGYYVLSEAEVTTQIDSLRPFIIRWGWATGGGHFVVGRGINSGYVDIMDPWPGNGYSTELYAWVVTDGSHTWTHTLEMSDYPASPTPTCSFSVPTRTPTPPTTPSPTPTSSATCAPCSLRANGHVYDGVSLQPLDNATVQLDWEDRCWEYHNTYFANQSGYYITGYYNTDAVGDGLLTASFSGYQTDNYDFSFCNDNLTQDFYLFPLTTPTPTCSVSVPTRTPTPVISSRTAVGDYNGDGTSDIALYRPSVGLWLVRGLPRIYFGGTADEPIPADYDGDGTWDYAYYRSSVAFWKVRNQTQLYFGNAGDEPVPADYDGDNSAEIAFFKPTEKLWNVLDTTRFYFGASSDEVMAYDFNGDGTDEGAIYRETTGLWRVRNITQIYFGDPGDIPVVADYNGDGTDDMAWFRPSTKLWRVYNLTQTYFGKSDDVIFPADFNGDGTADYSYFRPSVLLWRSKGVTRVYFGQSSDSQITNPY